MDDTDLAISFITFLTVLANLATLGILGLAVAGRAGVAARPWQALRTQLLDAGLGLAWLVAGVSTAGSLYFSEVAGFEPCRLCWYQRFCMYPLVVVLAAAAAPRGQKGLRWLALGLATIGALIAVYHVGIQQFPSLESGSCDATTPCSVAPFERLGFITLPYMALSGFLLIVTLLLASRSRLEETTQ